LGRDSHIFASTNPASATPHNLVPALSRDRFQTLRLERSRRGGRDKVHGCMFGATTRTFVTDPKGWKSSFVWASPGGELDREAVGLSGPRANCSPGARWRRCGGGSSREVPLGAVRRITTGSDDAGSGSRQPSWRMCHSAIHSLGYGPPQNSGLISIDLGRATLAKTRTTTIRAATATTTLSSFAFRTSYHAQFIRLRASATGARTGSSVGMANASESWMMR
jgi:hypothetical protein